MASAEDFLTDFAQNAVGLDMPTLSILQRQTGLVQSSRWSGSTENGRRGVSAARTYRQPSFGVGVRRSQGLGMGGGGRRAGSRASKGRKLLPNHHNPLVKVGGKKSATFSTPSGRSLQHSHAAASRAPAPCPEHILTLPLFISQAASGRVASAERWRRRWHGSGAPRRPRTHIHSHFITHTHTHNSHPP